ncbi:MAG: tripartite tricarboxylate transporter substrate binding protein [Betaproteobacteria bacterium]|nr:tripartite tricarboxylate transporter substrate binding protein [Betaproteobacteria bacterium]
MLKFTLAVLSLLPVLPAFGAAQDSAAMQALRARPVRIIVATAPGGGVDITARHLAKTMGELARIALVVQNRPGAGSITGTEYAARATPDGHTLLVSSSSSMVMNGLLHQQLPYDALRDFVAVGFVVAYPFVLIARNDLPVTNLAELAQYAKDRRGKLTYGSAGVGSLQHVWGTLLFRSMGLDLLHVPYKGAAMAVQEMIGGRIDLMFDNLSAARAQVQAGRVKALVVSPARRAPQMPAVPTVNESGVTQFEGESWMGVFVPSATPRGTVQALRGVVENVLQDAGLRERLEAGGGRIMRVPPQQQQAFVNRERERWGALIKRYGVTAE